MGIENRNWADPTPALLFGLAAGLTPLGLFIAGLIPSNASVMAGAYLFAIAVSNIICALILLRKGDVMWGTLALFFGTMLCAAGAATGLARATWVLQGMEADIPFQFEGWATVGCGVILLLYVPVLAKVSWSTVLASISCGVGLLLFGSAYVGGLASATLVTTMHVGGWGIAIFGLYCFYAGFAILTNTIYEKELIPLGAPIVKSAPVPAASTADATQ